MKFVDLIHVVDSENYEIAKMLMIFNKYTEEDLETIDFVAKEYETFFILNKDKKAIIVHKERGAVYSEDIEEICIYDEGLVIKTPYSDKAYFYDMFSIEDGTPLIEKLTF